MRFSRWNHIGSFFRRGAVRVICSLCRLTLINFRRIIVLNAVLTVSFVGIRTAWIGILFGSIEILANNDSVLLPCWTCPLKYLTNPTALSLTPESRVVSGILLISLKGEEDKNACSTEIQTLPRIKRLRPRLQKGVNSS